MFYFCWRYKHEEHSINRNITYYCWMFSEKYVPMLLSRKASAYFYFEQRTGACLKMEYQGCGGNKNRFDSQEECAQICEATATAVTEPASPMLPPVLTLPPIINSSNLRLKRDVDGIEIISLPKPYTDCEEVSCWFNICCKKYLYCRKGPYQ